MAKQAVKEYHKKYINSLIGAGEPPYQTYANAPAMGSESYPQSGSENTGCGRSEEV